MIPKTFIEACLQNPEAEIDLEDWIDDWHRGKAPKDWPLHQYLGMSWREYASWLQDPRRLGSIVEARRQASS